LSRNLIYDIAPYAPNILITFALLNKSYQERVYQVDYLRTFLEETQNLEHARTLRIED